MDIHPPTKPVESVKDYLIHLSMITIGILIALALEQAVEAWRHREVAEQARESIASEIRDNKKELEGEFALVAKDEAGFHHDLEVLEGLLARKKAEQLSFEATAHAASLRSTSWSTAQSTGALAFMGYQESKRFAEAYQVQDILDRLQRDEFRSVASVLAQARAPGFPEKLTEPQLRTLEQDVLACLAGVQMWKDVAQQLASEYAKVLNGR